MSSWKSEVIAYSTGQFVGNGLRFTTKLEAENYVYDLAMRWTSVRETRVVECAEAPTHRWNNKERLVEL